MPPNNNFISLQHKSVRNMSTGCIDVLKLYHSLSVMNGETEFLIFTPAFHQGEQFLWRPALGWATWHPWFLQSVILDRAGNWARVESDIGKVTAQEETSWSATKSTGPEFYLYFNFLHFCTSYINSSKLFVTCPIHVQNICCLASKAFEWPTRSLVSLMSLLLSLANPSGCRSACSAHVGVSSVWDVSAPCQGVPAQH